MATRRTKVELAIPRTEVLDALRAAGSNIPDPAVDQDIQNMTADVEGNELVVRWNKETTE